MRLLLVALVSSLFLIYNQYLGSFVPFVWPDEILFFNPSYEWFHSGFLRTTVLEGLIPGMERVTLWMPPLYFLLLGSSFHFVEPTIEYGRMLSTFLGLLGGLVLLYWIHRESISNNKRYFFSILFLLFFLTDILFLKVSHTSRMESFCALLGILALAFSYYNRYFYAGLAVGLSFLAHPFGAFYGIPILYNLYPYIKEKRFNQGIFLFLGGVIPISFWALYLIPNWDLFVIQFGAQLARKKDLFESFTYLDKLKIFLSGYFLPPLRLIVFLVLIGFSLPLIHHPVYKKFSRFVFVWLLAMLVGFLGSTESWYVIHSTYPLAVLFYFVAISLHGPILRKIFFSIILGYQILSFAWFQISFSYREDVFQKTDEFMSAVESIVKQHDTIYLQLIPDPYFRLKEKFPEKKFYEFIPGELPIPEDYQKSTIESIDLFLFFDERLMSPSLKPRLNNPDLFKKSEIRIPYKTRVPAKGPWRIVIYEKNI